MLSQHVEQLRRELDQEKQEVLKKSSVLKTTSDKEKPLEVSLAENEKRLQTEKDALKRIEEGLKRITPTTNKQELDKKEMGVKSEEAEVIKIKADIKKLEEKEKTLEIQIEKERSDLKGKSIQTVAAEGSKKQQQELLNQKKAEVQHLEGEVERLNSELSIAKRNSEIARSAVDAVKSTLKTKEGALTRAENEQKEALRQSTLKNRI